MADFQGAGNVSQHCLYCGALTAGSSIDDGTERQLGVQRGCGVEQNNIEPCKCMSVRQQ